MPYQSFPWEGGDSKSPQKLCALHLPDLSGKSVLDIGCNTGFFCGYAAWQGASRVVGVDNNPEFIASARRFFPQCQFYCQDWMNIDATQYDVIIFLSAIHYCADQQAMLDFLMKRVVPGGMLALEIGIAPGDSDEFVEVVRSIDRRCFPTARKLESMFSKYAAKMIGLSVPQAGDPLPRLVYHIRHRRPVAVLLMDEPDSGKSGMARELFRDNLRRVSGDMLYYEVMHGKRNASPEISITISKMRDGENLNCAAITSHICKNGWIGELCALVLEEARGRSFILDMYIPPPFRDTIKGRLDKKGFFVTDLQLYDATARPRSREWARPGLCREYMEYLAHDFLIDEKAYLAANPDVAEAVKKGVIPSAQLHYWHYGRKENRPLKPREKMMPAENASQQSSTCHEQKK